MIKAVLFDVDGVLLDSYGANRKFFHQLLTSFGYREPTPEEFSKTIHLSMMAAIRFLTNETSEEKIKIIWEKGLQTPYDYGMTKTPDNCFVVLKKLKEKYKMCVVSSRTHHGIEGFFKATHLKEFFETFVGFDDTTNHKPHPDPLFLAAKRLSVNPNECVYVGDTEADKEAAMAAGMKFIFYSTQPSESHVASFDEIPDLIAKF